MIRTPEQSQSTETPNNQPLFAQAEKKKPSGLRGSTLLMPRELEKPTIRSHYLERFLSIFGAEKIFLRNYQSFRELFFMTTIVRLFVRSTISQLLCDLYHFARALLLLSTSGH